MNTRKIRQVAKATRHHQKTPFTTKKEITAGGNSKNKAKGFSGGASAGLPAQALGLSLHGSAILLKISSDLVVKSHQEATIFEKAALAGGNFGNSSFLVGAAGLEPFLQFISGGGIWT